ncbi:MAG: HAD family hydrolase [Myxococcota bacterium]
MSSIAFFDLDLTLLSCNSATLWLKRQLKEGHISRWDALKMAGWIGMYQMGLADIEDAVRRAISGLEGKDEHDIRTRTEVFWAEEVVQLIRPEARNVLEQHRSAGDALVLLTGSSMYLSQCAVEELGLDDFLCTRFAVQDGIFTGKVEGTLCYGPGKLVQATAYTKERGVDLNDCVFYTDSYSDLPALEAVGTPIAAHPDPRLLRHAKKHGWSIVNWGE